jgi:hypothetical protein
MKNDNAKPVEIAAPQPPKRPYQPPTLAYLGTVQDLTHGIGGSAPDGSSQTQPSGGPGT